MKNQTKSEMAKVFTKLQKRVKEDSATGYFIVHVIAGHGVQFKGNQTLMTNEFDSVSNFYKRFPIEVLMRIFAKNNPNSFHLGIFACCREAELAKYEFVDRSKVMAEYDKEMQKFMSAALLIH